MLSVSAQQNMLKLFPTISAAIINRDLFPGLSQIYVVEFNF
jgi:hypothetical protein